MGASLGAAGAGTKTSTKTVTTPGPTVTTTTTQVTTKTVVRRIILGAPNRGITIKYGQWSGLFKLTGAHIIDDGFGNYSIAGQFTYLGGGTCRLGYVEVDGTFFQGSKITDASGLWNTQTAPLGVALPFSMDYTGPGGPTSAQLVVTQANCK